MARAARRQGGSQARKKGHSRRARSAQLEQLNLNAAGIDVGADAHWVAVPKDRDEQPVRCFGAFTADLYALAAWLRQCQIGVPGVSAGKFSVSYNCLSIKDF